MPTTDRSDWAPVENVALILAGYAGHLLFGVVRFAWAVVLLLILPGLLSGCEVRVRFMYDDRNNPASSPAASQPAASQPMPAALPTCESYATRPQCRVLMTAAIEGSKA